MTRSQAIINPTILRWARERAGQSLGEVSEKLRQPESAVRAWEDGDRRPTFRQAQQFARLVHVPFGYLFLKTPPVETVILPDLRTVGDRTPGQFSVDLKDVIRAVFERQQWYRDYLRGLEEPDVPVVGRAKLNDSVNDIVADMRRWLEVGRYPERGNWNDYFRDLVQRIERLGILVMRNSMVGNNTHRLLRVDEFRGFAIADAAVPVIFINSADVPEAQLFTLLHELVHIWLGESGISDGDPRTQRETEQHCNKVAAEFLVPEDEFLNYWDSTLHWEANLPVLAHHFHVSRWVIARRALELNQIDDGMYRRYVARRLREHRERDRDVRIDPFRLVPGRVSRPLAQAVASEALSGRMLLRDAYQLIGVKPANLKNFARKELKF